MDTVNWIQIQDGAVCILNITNTLKKSYESSYAPFSYG